MSCDKNVTSLPRTTPSLSCFPFSHLPSVSDPPDDLSVADVGFTWARIEWKEPLNPRGEIEGYRVSVLD